MIHWLTRRFKDFNTRPCLVYHDVTYTYGQLHDKVVKYQQLFYSRGISSGDTVTLLSDYSLNGVAALFALFELNAIVAPVAALSSEEGIQRREEARVDWEIDLRSRLSIEHFAKKGPNHPLIQRLARDSHPGLILFSSGSTGRPKAMIHDATRLLAPFEKKRPRKHRILIFLLFDHIGGLNTLFNSLASGSLIVIPKSRDTHAVATAIHKHRVNLLPASPTFLNLLLLSGITEKADLRSLRFITYGTEPMPESLLYRIKQALPDVALIQTFGTSETGISQTVSRGSHSNFIKFEDPHTETRIVNGELWLRSSSQILGYLNHDMHRFTSDGWFKTGDLVEQSTDGYLRITGRREDLINVGGEKVTPSEVESILLEIPEVADCVIYGEENAITGQNVAAQVVAMPGHEHKTLKRLIKNHCRSKLSAYKVPARITFTNKASFSDRFKKLRHPKD